MEYNGVKVLFKNGKTINIKMPEPNKFIDWITERDLSKTPFISIDDKHVINLTEVLYIRPTKKNIWRHGKMKWLLVILTVIFVIAKLLNIITWSWWLVFTPAIILLVIYLIVLILSIILECMK